ncbi:MAG TPA: argininosuccinate synthase [Methanomassiliicoccales archaeon]|jgi:argininosuccinate synthase|nr:argininosuccinate synthase [Methanomassiliicoccales archaeon]HQM66506.1 argininosuccinate synthase [Methanomassiliicoccales archaeon]HRR66074.1 argininosuccinate synthase [Methanomassiliicoccales archaeon]
MAARSRNARDKVVLAYSGGLDTSVAIRWLQQKYDLDVIAVSVNVGQPGDLQEAVDRALRIGAVKAYAFDATEEFVTEYIAPSLKANALYMGAYPLATSIARPLIAKTMVEIAKKEGAKYIAHGCTAKGNDQVRFDVSIAALAPEIKIIAPMREWVMTREEEIEYARQNDVPIKVKKECPYSTDENIWGRSCECGILEDAMAEPPKDAFEWTTDPLDAPDAPEYIEIDFRKGLPAGLDGTEMPMTDIIKRLNQLGGKHGYGRVDHIEDRLVGIKSREVYEAPAALMLINAHKDLEKMVLTKDVLNFKRGVEQRYSELCYDGLWFSPLKNALDAFVAETQEHVEGTVRVKLYKGSATIVGRSSPYSLYDTGLATYAQGDRFDHRSAEGFIYVWGLPLRTVAKAQKK